jgi:hypothetical protein
MDKINKKKHPDLPGCFYMTNLKPLSPGEGFRVRLTEA